MINRRTFLTTSAAFGVGLIAYPSSVLAADTIITILHTNDTHSQIDPLPANDANAAAETAAFDSTRIT